MQVKRDTQTKDDYLHSFLSRTLVVMVFLRLYLLEHKGLY